MAEENCLEKLKEEYGLIKEKYEFPEFLELNKVFDIEDIDSETDFLLRRIRRVISDRTAGYLRFVEIILNPSNSPMFFFKLINKLDEEDKKQLREINEKLGGFELEIVKLDLDYNEEKEADFIKKIYQSFNEEISKKLLEIVEKMCNGKGKEKGEGKENQGSYFG